MPGRDRRAGDDRALALGQDLEEVLRLAGIEALRVLDASLYPGDRGQRDSVLRRLREMLGDEDFERLRAEGARLSLDEAVDLALGEPETAGLPPPRAPGEVTVRRLST